VVIVTVSGVKKWRLIVCWNFYFFSNIGALRGTNWVMNTSMNASET